VSDAGDRLRGVFLFEGLREVLDVPRPSPD
jgi:hypothetical protein